MTKLTPPGDDIKNSNEQRILWLNIAIESLIDPFGGIL